MSLLVSLLDTQVGIPSAYAYCEMREAVGIKVGYFENILSGLIMISHITLYVERHK